MSQVLDHGVMDIARPDLKQKKRNKRQRIVGIGGALILAVAIFLVVRLEKSSHHRQYVTIKHDSRVIQAVVVLPKGPDTKLST